MKFGRLLQLQSSDLRGWPLIQYKLLKKKIKQRATTEQRTSIFETGSFKRQIRDDMVGNARARACCACAAAVSSTLLK